MKPTLFVLAAGMGSRYGGLKQLDGLGPNGETIMDHSIYDAIQSGFGKVVFVIRKDLKRISVKRFCQNMKIIFRWKWYSSRLTHFLKDSLARLTALNRGVPTTPF